MFPSKFLAKNKGLTFYWSIYPFHGDLWRLDTPPPWEVKGLTQEFHKRSALPANVPRTTEVEVEVENAWWNIQSMYGLYVSPWRFGKCLEFITSWLGSTLISWRWYRWFVHIPARGIRWPDPKVIATIDSLPVETHPMTQLSVAMLALQKDSKFFKTPGQWFGVWITYRKHDLNEMITESNHLGIFRGETETSNWSWKRWRGWWDLAIAVVSCWHLRLFSEAQTGNGFALRICRF